MRVAVTGAAGFLGRMFVEQALGRGEVLEAPLTSLLLMDRVESAPQIHDVAAASGISLQSVVGDLLAHLDALESFDPDVVIHLASAVSGECEADFDLGLNANLRTTMELLERLRRCGVARQQQRRPLARLLFASSVAVFGSDPVLAMPSVIEDQSLPTPQSSYGVQKFVCEQLIADYTRKQFIDGRVARLMTVSVRPGRPNGAASGFLSGIIREPLSGQRAICPVPLDTRVALASPQNTLKGMWRVLEASRDEWPGRIAVNLPALTVSVSEMLLALEQIGGRQAVDLVEHQPDARVQAVVGGWPSKFDSQIAVRLGLSADSDFHSVVMQYVSDHRAAVTNQHALSMID